MQNEGRGTNLAPLYSSVSFRRVVGVYAVGDMMENFFRSNLQFLQASGIPMTCRMPRNDKGS